MTKLIVTALLLSAVSFGQSGAAIPPGSKVYIAPMEEEVVHSVGPAYYSNGDKSRERSAWQSRPELGLPVTKSQRLEMPALSADESRPKVIRHGLRAVGVHRSLPKEASEIGAWQTVSDGRRLWRMAVRSPGASGIRLHFTEFDVGGGRVWIHGEGEPPGVERLEPYTGRGIFDDGDFWTGTVFSEVAVVEYEPEIGRDGESPTFRIVTVSHQFGSSAVGPGLRPLGQQQSPQLPLGSSLLRSGNAVGAGGSERQVAACHLDVTCYPEWADSAKAVAGIGFETDEGPSACSGALLNTKASSFLPYFLTANHCVSDDATARTVNAFFYYQTSSCNGPAPSPWDAQQIVGARYLVSRDMSEGDFSLLWLAGPPKTAWFAGWTTAAPNMGDLLTGIHHPAGDYKRISFGVRVEDTESRVEDESGDVHVMPADRSWTVLETSGRTQGGSSGSSLFSKPSVVVGILSTGPKTSKNADERDLQICQIDPFVVHYGRFSVAYPYLRPYLEQGAIVAPPNGATLTSGTVSFTWAGGAVTEYVLFIGNTVGGYELLSRNLGTALTTTVSGLPTDGRVLYARLWSKIEDDWRYLDYVYRASTAPAFRAAEIISPPNGTVLNSSSVAFVWNSGLGVREYVLYIGNRAGGSEIFSRNTGSALSVSVNGLPTDGRTLFVRLWSGIGSDWYFNDYTYRAFTAPAFRAAEMVSPPAGTTFASSTVTFNWNAGIGVREYGLYIGNRAGANDILNRSTGISLSTTVAGLPTDGRILYVRLWSTVGNNGYFNDYVYRAFTIAQRTVTLGLTNKLVYPVTVSVNGSSLTTVPASTTVQANATVSGSLTVAFDLVRPQLSGVPLGDTMSGVFSTISNPSGTINFIINNRIGDQWYFAPRITNQTSAALLLEVNGGLQAQNRCNCTAPPYSSNVAFGYYRFFSNSNVRAYRTGSGYTGTYIYFDNLASSVETDTGVLRLTFDRAP